MQAEAFVYFISLHFSFRRKKCSESPAPSSDELSSGETIASPVKTSTPIGKSYAVGQEHGLTTLQLL